MTAGVIPNSRGFTGEEQTIFDGPGQFCSLMSVTG
jgi:hypothetical protein